MQSPPRQLIVEKDYEAAVDEILAQMNHLDTEVRRKPANIDRLRIETQVLLDELKTSL
jgi:hypothetical protein